jgi:protein SCO1/2
MKIAFVLGFMVLTAAGCREEPAAGVHYRVRGTIREIAPDRRQVTLQHEKIPGFMDAMTMPFKVKRAMVLDGYEPGEEVLFDLVVTPTDAFIDGLTSIAPRLPDAGSGGGRPADNAAMIHIPRIGEKMPDIVLTNQDGSRVRLRDHKGKILALNFIFTRCPLPTFCPRSMREFKTLRQNLGDVFGKDVEFLGHAQALRLGLSPGIPPLAAPDRPSKRCSKGGLLF